MIALGTWQKEGAGVVAVSWHFGHWAYGAGDVSIDSQAVGGEAGRATGLCPNAAMRLAGFEGRLPDRSRGR